MARKGKIIIHREKCKGCYLCIKACPVKVIEKDAELNTSGAYPARPIEGNTACIACSNCYEVCPDVCIEVFEIM
ncbi:MAG: 4Fe-4S binding protein [Treponema sp.]|nr:4Fe-4S binding protein [Treponema sp.]